MDIEDVVAGLEVGVADSEAADGCFPTLSANHLC